MANDKKVLISGYIGFSNFGDDAMLQTLVEHLKEQGVENITALSSNPEDTKKKFGINALKYKNIFDILSGIMSSNIVIQGGGNLIQNETSVLSLFYYLFIILLSKLFFKKVILYSQGIGPVRGIFSRFLSKLILRLPDSITVRDIYSQRILSKWGIKSKYTYDALWSFSTPEYAPKGIVGIQLRDFYYTHKDFYKNLAKYVDMFFSECEIRIYSFQNKTDAQECYKFEKLLRSRNALINTKVVLYSNPNQIAEEFSQLKYLIAMRLHANILGLKLGVKVLPVSYSVKVRNLAYEFELDYQEAQEDSNLHGLLTELTSKEQVNSKIEDAHKRKFDWSLIDSIINK